MCVCVYGNGGREVVSISWAIYYYKIWNWPLIKSNRIEKWLALSFIQSNFYFSFKFLWPKHLLFFLHHLPLLIFLLLLFIKTYSISNLAEATSVLNFAFGQKEIKTAKVKWGKKPNQPIEFWMKKSSKKNRDSSIWSVNLHDNNNKNKTNCICALVYVASRWHSTNYIFIRLNFAIKRKSFDQHLMNTTTTNYSFAKFSLILLLTQMVLCLARWERAMHCYVCTQTNRYIPSCIYKFSMYTH